MTNTPEWHAHINHLMLCSNCFAPAGKYCAVGRELWLADTVAYVCSLPTLHERRNAMQTVRAMSPGWVAVIEGMVVERFNQTRRAA